MPQTFVSSMDPDEVRDFGIDWSADIGSNTIASSVWTVVSGTITIVADSHTTKTTTVRLHGGVVGTKPAVLNHIILSDGEELELTCSIKIKAA